jgi:hypothetical protein
MRKLRLNVEDLGVDSFQTEAADRDHGTVVGLSDVGPTSRLTTCGDRTLDQAVGTCAETCVNALDRTVCGANRCTENCTMVC